MRQNAFAVPGPCWKSLQRSPRPSSWIWGNGDGGMEMAGDGKGTEGKEIN